MTDLKGIKTVHSLTLGTSETALNDIVWCLQNPQSVENTKQSVEKVQMKC